VTFGGALSKLSLTRTALA